jgi:uncharacterized glyoxalase superfamily protein PhnB
MAKRILIEQLDQAVQELLARPSTEVASADSELQPLLRVADGLRGLPKETFKARLRAELQEKKMTITADSAPSFMRKGFHTITPYIGVREAHEVIDFMKQTFGAEGTILGLGSAGGIHAEYKIGNSMVMVGGGAEAKITPTPAALHVYVPDVDAAYQRALQAGAISLRAPQDQFYGDRDASVQDLAGNQWYIGTHRASGLAPEGLRSVTPCLLPKGATEVMDFLKHAFAAQEVSRHASPQGVIRHATMRIGDSMIELGEAHGPFQPMSSMFYLYVESSDEWYQQAMDAGATSISPPADQPYGDRVAAVKDPFGNHWYMATHIAAAKV